MGPQSHSNWRHNGGKARVLPGLLCYPVWW
jgi:hypothetical protein